MIQIWSRWCEIKIRKKHIDNSPVSSSLWPLNKRSEDTFFTGLSSSWGKYIHKFQWEKDPYLLEFVNNLLYVETNPLWMCRLFFLYSVVIFNSKLDLCLPLKKAVVKALSTHIQIFLKMKIFSSFLKKYTSTCSIFKFNVFTHPHKNSKTMEIRQHPLQNMHNANSIWCLIDVWHHHIQKPLFSSVHM